MSYRALRSIAFRFDPERVHRLALGAHRVLRPFRRPFPFRPVTVMGLEFPNVVGLAAGYDKDATAWRGLAALGFGHVEVGTVTPRPQPGNSRPRVFRLPQDDALINRMGFPSEGADAVAARLRGDRTGMVLGVSIGPNRFDDRDRAVADYELLVDRFAPLADYLAVNVSSPNTPGLRAFETTADLAHLLDRLSKLRRAAASKPPALVVKLSPDLDTDELPEMVAAIEASGVDGIALTNTTTRRPALSSATAAEAGGLSGAPLRPIALDLLQRVRRLTELPLIASGGVMSLADARERLDAGASLVQLYTGFVYCGPQLVRDVAALEGRSIEAE
jgi:dihydroorotate dehydrogenase